MSRIKIPFEEVKESILALDSHKIGIEELKVLAKNTPTQEEIEVLKSFPDDPATLGKPEQFFLQVPPSSLPSSPPSLS